MKQNLQQRVGCSLTMLRHKAGLSQRSLSSRLSISRSAYCQYEQGTRLPDVHTLYRLCRFYHIRVDTLLNCDTVTALQEYFLYQEYTQKEVRLLVLYNSLSDFSKGRLLERARELAELDARDLQKSFLRDL